LAVSDVKPAISAERKLAALAGRQHGVVARRQLSALGFSRHAIGHRIETGRLQILHRGVYAVGHGALTREGRWMAAVLSGGRGAVLSHRSAAMLWGIRRSARDRIEVTVSRQRRPRERIQYHQIQLELDQVAIHEGIPVTTPARTLDDLATVLGPHQLERAVEQAEILRLVDARGVARVGPTESPLEDDFLAFVARYGLPRPNANMNIQVADRWFRPDCAWPHHRLVVELDSRSIHDTVRAFERDRERDRLLAVAGWRTIRITWRQLHDDPAALARDLSALLATDKLRG
jgi:hypothetical protein